MSQVHLPVLHRRRGASSVHLHGLVDSCGLSPDSAAATIKKLSVCAASRKKTGRNPEAVLELFRSQGFSRAQIARIVALRPQVLFSERTLKPQVDYLRSEGFSQNDIAKLVPSLTDSSLEKMIKPNFDILNTFLPSKYDIVAATRCPTRSRWLLQLNLKKTILPNLEKLRAIGVPEKRISQLIMLNSLVLSRLPRRFDEYIEMLKGIGFSPTTYRYIHALIALSGLSRATLQKKISFYRNLGITEEDLFSALRLVLTILGLSEKTMKKTFKLLMGFGLRDDEISSFFGRRAPALFVLSEQNISKSMDFLVRALDCKPRDVLSGPMLLMLSLERRLVPRAFVRTALLSKGLLRGDRVHFRIFTSKEDEFVDNYVMKFRNELPQLQEEYEKLKAKHARSSVSNETSTSLSNI